MTLSFKFTIIYNYTNKKMLADPHRQVMSPSPKNPKV